MQELALKHKDMKAARKLEELKTSKEGFLRFLWLFVNLADTSTLVSITAYIILLAAFYDGPPLRHESLH